MLNSVAVKLLFVSRCVVSRLLLSPRFAVFSDAHGGEAVCVARLLSWRVQFFFTTRVGLFFFCGARCCCLVFLVLGLLVSNTCGQVLGSKRETRISPVMMVPFLRRAHTTISALSPLMIGRLSSAGATLYIAFIPSYDGDFFPQGAHAI